MSAITDLQKKIQSLESQLFDARESLRAAQLEAFPVKIGQQVKITSGGYKGELAAVADIHFKSYSNSPWVYVRRYKKDGTLREHADKIYSAYEVLP